MDNVIRKFIIYNFLLWDPLQSLGHIEKKNDFMVHSLMRF